MTKRVAICGWIYFSALYSVFFLRCGMLTCPWYMEDIDSAMKRIEKILDTDRNAVFNCQKSTLTAKDCSSE